MSYFQESIKKINLDYLKVQERNDQLEDVLALNDLDVDKKFEFKVGTRFIFAYNPERIRDKRFVVKYNEKYGNCEKVRFLGELDNEILKIINDQKSIIRSSIEKELGTCAFD